MIEVIELKNKHKLTWRNKPQWCWMLGLLEEVIELIGSLIGIHKGPTNWELTQISAICMNWIEYRKELGKQ